MKFVLVKANRDIWLFSGHEAPTFTFQCGHWWFSEDEWLDRQVTIVCSITARRMGLAWMESYTYYEVTLS